jgi:hypothetical protein
MPWTKTDYPNSMKNLSPNRREKAISIANAILREGGDEGMAIATGISRSKSSSIVKLAALSVKSKTILTSTLMGGLMGSRVGLAYSDLHKNKNKSKWKPILIGAGIGAGVGAGMGTHYYNKAPIFTSHRNQANAHENFFKEYGEGITHNDIKTKAHAEKIYRKASMKYHPDLNPGNKAAEDKQKLLNAHWEKVKSGSWFEKKASMKDFLKKPSKI